MIQRSSTTVDLARYEGGKGLYCEDGPPIRDADLLAQCIPTALLKRNQIEATGEMRRENWRFFEMLEGVGFRLNWGPDGAG